MRWSDRRTEELVQRQREQRLEELEARARKALGRIGPIEAAVNLLRGETEAARRERERQTAQGDAKLIAHERAEGRTHGWEW